jgi:hypothetical protein
MFHVVWAAEAASRKDWAQTQTGGEDMKEKERESGYVAALRERERERERKRERERQRELTVLPDGMNQHK